MRWAAVLRLLCVQFWDPRALGPGSSAIFRGNIASAGGPGVLPPQLTPDPHPGSPQPSCKADLSLTPLMSAKALSHRPASGGWAQEALPP